MSARQKLNSAAVHGAIVVAALVGLVFQSWLVFFVTSALLVGTAFLSGDIRLGGRRF